MIHAYPQRRTHKYSWCYQEVRGKRVAKGSASKMFNKITCPECKRRVGAMLNVTKGIK